VHSEIHVRPPNTLPNIPPAPGVKIVTKLFIDSLHKPPINLHTHMKLKTAIPSIAAALLAAAPFASAQNATTDPVGFVTTTIRSSADGVAFAVTPISPVLLAASGVSGTTTGSVTSVGSNTLSITSAGWTADQLPLNDVFVLFTTGNLTGLILPVTANTPDTLTVSTEGLNLSTSGASDGDMLQLIQGDTIESMFGNSTTGVVGGSSSQFSSSQTDKVTLTDAGGLSRTYYYNTDNNQWQRSGSSASQNSIRISPTAGAFYSRISTSNLTITTSGNVPITQAKYILPTSGSRFLARYFPTDGTINDFNLQSLPGWRSTDDPGVTIADADKLATTDAGGLVRTYYYNGTNWVRSGSGANQNSVVVPAGGSVRVTRFGTGSAEIATVATPYSL
jgi:uncharacterized protein (TIGR02597 family)